MEPHEAHNHIKCGGLAGAIGAKQANGLAAAQLDGDVTDHRTLLVGFANATGDQATRFRHQAQRVSAIGVGKRAGLHSHFGDSLLGVLPEAFPVSVPDADDPPPEPFGTINPCTRRSGASVMVATPVFMFTMAAAPFN